MKKSLIIPLAALTIATLACGPVSIHVNVPNIQTGPTETLTVNEPLPDTKSATDVTLAMGAGRLNLIGGGDGLVTGTVRYNVPEWKPTLTSTSGSFTLQQGDSKVDGFPNNDVVNEWDLKLGNAPINLTVRAGAYQGNFDLSAVPLRNLSIDDGASDSTVVFSSVNPEQMDTLSYHSGASSVELSGLANANFKTMSFDGGAGNYTLDFSGELQRDAHVTVNGGVGSIKIVVPANTAAEVDVTRGLGSLDASGGWTTTGDTYTLSGSGPKFTITVRMGVGSVELMTK